jgi:uncharacterized BrkB/YihY/UPF0761 family membrane protein
MKGRLRAWIGEQPFGRAVLRAAGGYSRHATSQLAAAVSFRLLFSLVPLAAFVVSVVGFHLATAVYALYLANYGNVTAVYGPLAAVLGFLLVVHVGLIVILH